MKGHAKRYVAFETAPRCECGWTGHSHVDHITEMLAELHAFHRDYYQRTGHCGLCGQPGNWCLCTDRDPCGCASLHQIGSGVGRDATDVFAEASADDVPMFEVGS